MGKKDRARASNAACLVDIIESNGRIVATFDCKACARESDLASDACWKGVSSAVAHSSSLDSIVLAGHVETEYAGRGLEAMEAMRRVGAAARRFSARAPPSDSKACSNCGSNPARLFGGCAEGLTGGIRAGHAALAKAELALMGGMPSPSCEGCFRAAEKDLAYLRREYVAICRGIMRDAYGIVGESA